MDKITIVLLLCIISALAGKLPESSIKSLPALKVELVEDIKAFLLKNPELIELKKVLLYDQERQVIRYTLGEPHPADIRLAEATDVYNYHIPQDFALQLTYPEVGVGGIVKFVEILVDQNSNIGKAYIVAGSLGERFIRIIVEAGQITHFHYRASFYGQ